MAEIPEVYGQWESPCCGDPGDCNEPCAQAFREAGHPFPEAAAAFAGTAGTFQRIDPDASPLWRASPIEGPRLLRTDGEPVDPRMQTLVDAWWRDGGEQKVEEAILERARASIFGYAIRRPPCT